jgi:hypothetical protein
VKRTSASNLGPRFESLEKRRLLAVSPGTGLVATYFANENFTGKSVERIDKKVYFEGNAALPSGVAASTYSIRWTGKIKPSYSQKYTFTTCADDGVRVWVDHQLIIDDWNTHAMAARSGSINLSASKKVDIDVEYFNHTGNASAQLWWSSASQAKSVVPTSRLYPQAPGLVDKIDHAFTFAQSQLTKTLADVGNNPDIYVINTDANGAWQQVDGASWVSGFLAGEMWELYQHDARKTMRLDATKWTQSLADQTALPDDMGFRIGVPFMPMYQASKSAGDRDVLLAAADAKMGQWNSTVGMFRSSGGSFLASAPDGDFAVLVDNAMDMNLLYWASNQTGNATYADRATAHLLKLAHDYVHADGSVAQWGYYSSTTGAFIGHTAKQGYSAESAWSRGQAWAMYAYADAYSQTHNATLLSIAESTANYYLAHMPADGVPYWDFNAPTIPNTYRDTSAAAIAADAFVQLATMEPDATKAATYRVGAEKILNSLVSSPYLAEGSSSHGILLHGALYVPRKTPVPDASLIFGDYYLLDAMNRYTAASH